MIRNSYLVGVSIRCYTYLEYSYPTFLLWHLYMYDKLSLKISYIILLRFSPPPP